jgi:hypothetical protein
VPYEICPNCLHARSWCCVLRLFATQQPPAQPPGGSEGGGPTPGEGGPPGGGGSGGGPPGGGGPAPARAAGVTHAATGGTNGQLRGVPPKPYEGKQGDAEAFLQHFKLF